MKDFRRYENTHKVYVTVKATFYEGGGFAPTAVIWEDGREFEIDQVMDVRMAASQKAGAIGIRYTCRIRGKQTYLFLEEDRWFVERRL